MRKIICGCVLAALAGCQTFCEKSAMEARYYPVEMPIFERMKSLAEAQDASAQRAQDSENSGWKEFFEQFDVMWPEGSSIRYVKGIGKLRVVNTPENHELLEAAFADCRRMAGTDTMIEVEVRFIEVGQKALDELGSQLAAKKAADARYDLGDFANVAPAEFERALVSRRDLADNQSWKIVARDRENAVGKRVTEYIYPTDYDVTGSTNSPYLAVEPQSFVMHEVGIILDATPMAYDDGKAIDLRLNAQIVDEPTWHDYGFEIPAPDGKRYELPMEQPNFSVRGVDTNIELVSGEPKLVSGSVRKGKDGEDKTMLVFVRATLLGKVRR